MSLVEKKNWYLDYLLIIVGTGLMALAINSVFDATGLVTGGFSGIAILVKEWTEGVVPGGIPLWITNLSLNIPLFLIGMKLSGFQFVKRALVGEICLSFWLSVRSPSQPGLPFSRCGILREMIFFWLLYTVA